MKPKSNRLLQNRYRVIALLDQGGMAAVYRARDTRLNIAVALKEMIPQPGIEQGRLAQLRQQFQQEAQTLARLNHPHLVRVSDFFQEAGRAYLVMDYVEGESLAERIARKGKLPEDDVLQWAQQLLEALAYCHAQGVIHRDVKPQNVIIRPDGQAVLVDFGLVKLWDPGDPRTKTQIRGMGTPEYAPPEQYDMEMGHTDARSDIYGLGATLYHALAGQAPPTATLRMADPEKFKPLGALAPEITRDIADAIMKALTLARSRRWQSAREMARALGVAVPSWQTPAEQASTGARPGPQRTRVMTTGESQASSKEASAAPAAVPSQAASSPARRLPGWVWGVGGLVLLGLVAGMATIVGTGGGGSDPTLTPTATESAPAAVPTVTEETATFTPSPSPSPSPTATATPWPTRTPTERPTSTLSATTPRPTPSTTPTPRPVATATPIPATPTQEAPTQPPQPTEPPAEPTQPPQPTSPPPEPTEPPAPTEPPPTEPPPPPPTEPPPPPPTEPPPPPPTEPPPPPPTEPSG